MRQIFWRRVRSCTHNGDRSWWQSNFCRNAQHPFTHNNIFGVHIIHSQVTSRDHSSHIILTTNLWFGVWTSQPARYFQFCRQRRDASLALAVFALWQCIKHITKAAFSIEQSMGRWLGIGLIVRMARQEENAQLWSHLCDNYNGVGGVDSFGDNRIWQA